MQLLKNKEGTYLLYLHYMLYESLHRKMHVDLVSTFNENTMIFVEFGSLRVVLVAKTY